MNFTEEEQKKIHYAAKLSGTSEEEFVLLAIEEKIKKEHLFKPEESIILRNIEIYRLYEETGNIIKIADQYGISDLATTKIARDVRNNKEFYDSVVKDEILMDVICNSTYEAKFLEIMIDTNIRTIEELMEYLYSDRVKHSPHKLMYDTIFRYIRTYYPEYLREEISVESNPVSDVSSATKIKEPFVEFNL